MDTASIITAVAVFFFVVRGEAYDLLIGISDNRVRRVQAKAQAEIAKAQARSDEVNLELAKISEKRKEKEE